MKNKTRRDSDDRASIMQAPLAQLPSSYSVVLEDRKNRSRIIFRKNPQTEKYLTTCERNGWSNYAIVCVRNSLVP